MRAVPIVATMLSVLLFFVDGTQARAAAEEDGDVVDKEKNEQYRFLLFSKNKHSKKNSSHNSMTCLSLFENSAFIYTTQCKGDMMVSTTCDEGGACYISENLVDVPRDIVVADILVDGQYNGADEDEVEEICSVGGSFQGTNNINYNDKTGDCELMDTDLPDDPCGLLTKYGVSSLGLMARINPKHPNKMYILFTSDKGETYYNDGEEREAVRDVTARRLNNNNMYHQQQLRDHTESDHNVGTRLLTEKNNNKIKNKEKQERSLEDWFFFCVQDECCDYVRITKASYLDSSQCGEVVENGCPYCFQGGLANVVLSGNFPGSEYTAEKGTCAEAKYTKFIETIALDGGPTFGIFKITKSAKN